jgi:hypothetical protein
MLAGQGTFEVGDEGRAISGEIFVHGLRFSARAATRVAIFLRSIRHAARWQGMGDLDRLHARMAQAAAALDFEEASRLRDRIALMRGGASLEEAVGAETTGLKRQQPSAMGLGTSQQKLTPPAGWKPPTKPDPMTKGRSRRR